MENEKEKLEDEEMNEDVNEESEVESESENDTEDEKDKRIKELEHDLAVCRADSYNYRQRVIKERSETRKRSQEEVITAILPVLDNLNRALESAHMDDGTNILTGVEMVQRQFMSVLDSLGVSEIKTEGESFDPALHDASGTEEVNDPELDGKIISERLKGYRTKERVLRPAQVTVGKKKN
ncbi:MAG: nucleotide exchange factor GrpE [Synergistaceae bacterium]|nr:nucleotide exchange factor GrpE [Synergistaceae bacterium]MBQ3694647.1 nucleotide exchange factor GrpE [Synergistaceae bacterium]MBQ9629080.1 nucleotide exchange factor GrpE [Synergistaceae bacterium]MBR0069215.1 nucleotide exchange factor GrpE [Synergistaceae bacterium]MBR0251492.1 nucleotide exchange factor GrpE [Synergistaceae bacterium]